MNKSVTFDKLGNYSVLKITESPIPEPGNDEVRIKINAVGLNRAEQLFFEGKYLIQPKLPVQGLGYEGSGVIDGVGQGVNEFKIGDRVSTLVNFTLDKYTTHHQYAILPKSSVVKNPDYLDDIQASTLWVAYLTGYFALVDVGHIKNGDYVVVTAASSSTGLAAIQIAKAHGAIVIATSRTDGKKAVLLEYGADHFIATATEDVSKRILEITNGKGANIIYDPVGGDAFVGLANATAPLGTLILYGLIAKEPTPFPVFAALSKHIQIKGYNIFEYTSQPKHLERAIQYILQQVKEKKFKSIVGKLFKGDISSIIDAYKYLDQADLVGKVVVQIN